MKNEYLEAGKIVNTHGIRGEVKIQPWADTPGFLLSFDKLYIDGTPHRVLSARVHKSFVIAAFEGVSDIDAAVRLKNKVVFIDRKDAKLPEGKHFIQDMIGMTACDADTGEELGTVTDILPLPAGSVYVISGKREILVPDAGEFIIETDMDGGRLRIRLIEGM